MLQAARLERVERFQGRGLQSVCLVPGALPFRDHGSEKRQSNISLWKRGQPGSRA